MAEQPALLNVQGLTVGWHGKPVAHLESISVAPGEIVVLAGPNGVGKSTVLKTVARHIVPLEGSTYLNGIDTLTVTAKRFAQQVSYVPQMLDPPHKMRVYDMVALGRNPHQPWCSWQQSEKDQAAIKQAMLATETESLSDQQASNLSGGERQRVGIAMALAQESRLILLDEPTAHLDYKHQLNLMLLIEKLKTQGIGILIALHDLDLIGRIADSVILMYRCKTGIGKIAAKGKVDLVLTRPLLHQAYGIEVSISKDLSTGITSYIPLKAAGNTS